MGSLSFEMNKVITTTKNIAMIGECMIELSQKGKGMKCGFGGDTLNTSIYLSRLVHPRQLQVYYVTALGSDPFSDDMLKAFQQEGVSINLIQRMKNRLPGLYYITTNSSGERDFYYWRNVSSARYWLRSRSDFSKKIFEKLASFDYLYLSGISLAILSSKDRIKLLSLLYSCRANGGKVIFDNNYRPQLWKNKKEAQKVYRNMLACTNIAFLTLDDEDALWGMFPVEKVLARTGALGVEEIVIKRGAESCLVKESSGELREVQAVKLPKEKIIDTTAAGDSFSAGYLSVRLTGGSSETAAKIGHLTASRVIQYHGSIIPREVIFSR